MNTQTAVNDKVRTFLSGLNTEIDILNLIDLDNIDQLDAYNSIYEMINDNSGFDIEVIYYYEAMKYLSENDNSLKESLELANNLGYTIESLNSELLASLLKSENVRNEFAQLESEINDFFAELEEETEEE